MPLRDHMQKVRKYFSQQYQTIKINWSKCVSSKACNVKTESGKGTNSSLVLFEENFSSLLEMSKMISLENDDFTMEISMNTAGYKPTELKVKVANGEISIEGKLDEKSEECHTMKTKLEHKKSVGIKENEKSSEPCVPLTMRDSFFDDPFFKDTWLDIESSQKNFLEKSLKCFDKNMKSMESSTKQTSMLLNDWSMPNICAQDSDSDLNSKDSNLIHMVNDDSKMEISLDITNYKPDELNVSARKGVICVEGKHEEKSEAGQVMVARQFSRKYSLPAGARAEEMVYNLSQDGVLVISVPKMKAN